MADATVRVLLVEDSPSDARLIQLVLSRAEGQHFEIAVAGRVDEAIAKLHEQVFDVALIDLTLPDSSGLSTFTRIQAAAPQLPIVVLTGADDEATGVEAIRLGVQDYLVKGQADGRVVARSIRYAVERKRAEEALRKTVDELARSNRDLEHFAYVASHDLQEPLRTVRSYAQLLQRRYKGKMDSDADEFIGFVMNGAERMQMLIEDLLAYSRVSSAPNQPVPTESEPCLTRALGALSETLKSAGASVTYDPLPTVVVDGKQLTQLFQNLVGNGIKFHQDGVPPQVHVAAREEGEEWVLSVRDNGIGIEPQYHERVFTIFERLHGQNEYSGTGIGLTICKRIVERHGGRIWLESKPGEGSTFYFTMPSGGK